MTKFIFLLLLANQGEAIVIEQPSLPVCHNQLEYYSTIVSEDTKLECIKLKQNKVFI